MNKLFKKVMYIIAGMLMLFAGYLISIKYNMKYFELLKSVFLITIVCITYLILHEIVHAIVAYILHMKIIFIQFLGMVFCLDERKFKILKKYNDFWDVADCLALPTWKNSVRQWVWYTIMPILLTILLIVFLGVLQVNDIVTGTTIKCIYYTGIIYCMWSLIPLEGADIYYLYMYFFYKDKLEMYLFVMQSSYSILYSDVCENIEYKQNATGKSELEKTYICSFLRYRILEILLCSKYDKKCFEWKTLEDTSRQNNDEELILYQIFKFLCGSVVEKKECCRLIQNNDTYDGAFLRIIIGMDNDTKRLKEKFKEEIELAKEIGIGNPYKKLEELYIAKADELIINRKKENNEILLCKTT